MKMLNLKTMSTLPLHSCKRAIKTTKMLKQLENCGKINTMQVNKTKQSNSIKQDNLEKLPFNNSLITIMLKRMHYQAKSILLIML